MHQLISLALVDDDPAVRDLWTRQLNRATGFVIAGVFGSAEAALATLLAAPSAVVLVDWKLPGLDGITLTARLKAAHPQTRVVLITNHDLDELPLAALRAGVDGCLLKPDSPAALPARLRAVMDGTCVFSQRIMQRLAAQTGQLVRTGENPALALLTTREREVLRLLGAGCSLKEAADRMQVAYSTVNTLRERAYRKLGAHKLTEALVSVQGLRPPLPPPPPSPAAT
jgi:DNA-binding NarL/FixJ family response regulator